MVSSQLLVAIDASRLSQGEIGSGNFDPTEDAASRNWSPTAARMKNIKAIMIKPAQIIAPVMPSSWPRLTFLISPLKDTELIAKRIENAGQIRKLIVEPKLKPGLRFVPPLLAVAITLSNAPVPARASKLLLKLKTPAAVSASTIISSATLASAIQTDQRWKVKYTFAPRKSSVPMTKTITSPDRKMPQLLPKNVPRLVNAWLLVSNPSVVNNGDQP